MTIVKNPAPADTPIIPGSANGFFMTACNKTPETDNVAPANNAIMILGKRKSFTTAIWSFGSPNNPFINANIDISMLPVVAAYKTNIGNAIQITIKLIVLFNIHVYLFTTALVGNECLLQNTLFCYLLMQ